MKFRWRHDLPGMVNCMFDMFTTAHLESVLFCFFVTRPTLWNSSLPDDLHDLAGDCKHCWRELTTHLFTEHYRALAHEGCYQLSCSTSRHLFTYLLTYFLV